MAEKAAAAYHPHASLEEARAASLFELSSDELLTRVWQGAKSARRTAKRSERRERVVELASLVGILRDRYVLGTGEPAEGGRDRG